MVTFALHWCVCICVYIYIYIERERERERERESERAKESSVYNIGVCINTFGTKLYPIMIF
jgi:hypothetical protein